jgi:two-component system nitrate/nitrite response regulator NarL
MRVFLIEAQDIVLRGLTEVLQGLAGVDLVGGASSWERASFVLGLPRQAPTVLVVASEVVDRGQLEQLVALVAPRPKVLVLLKGTEPAQLQAAAQLQADGYALERGLDGAALLDALVATERGDVPLPAALARRLLGGTQPEEPGPTLSFLTPREGEVLGLLAEGYSNKQIARALRISEHGAKHHVGNVLAKLHCPTRAAAVTVAAREGLLRARPRTVQIDPNRQENGRLQSNRASG